VNCQMPGVLPPGYRFRLMWAGRHGLEIAGRMRRREYVRVVQRCSDWPDGAHSGFQWHDVGFWEEVVPAIVKPKSFAEL
jgi:hypothetical protein